MYDEPQSLPKVEKVSFGDSHLWSCWARPWKGMCKIYRKQSAQSGGADDHECLFIVLVWYTENRRTHPVGKPSACVGRTVASCLGRANFCTHRPVNENGRPPTRMKNAYLEYTSKIWRWWAMRGARKRVSWSGKNRSLTDATVCGWVRSAGHGHDHSVAVRARDRTTWSQSKAGVLHV